MVAPAENTVSNQWTWRTMLARIGIAWRAPRDPQFEDQPLLQPTVYCPVRRGETVTREMVAVYRV